MNSYKSLLNYIIIFISTLLIVLGILNLFQINIFEPLNYKGDAIVHYNFAKNIEDSGWWPTNNFYGAPRSQQLFDFPLTEILPLLIIKLLISLGINWILSVNFFYILTFPLAAVFAFYTLTKLNIKTQVAVPLAIIYAFIPYHFYRGVNHLFLASYFTVPLSILASYYTANNNFPNKLAAVVLGVIIASSGAYYTFLSLVLIFVAIIFGLINNKIHLKNYLNPTLLTATILFSFVLNLAPTLIYNFKFGNNLNATTREPSETEMYGLKITQLVLPIEDHNLGFLNKITKKYLAYGYQPFINENQYSSLGVVASVGFLFLLFWILFRPHKIFDDKETNSQINLLATLNIATVLFATVGGFGMILSTYFNPVFRSQNRVSIFIAFLALIAIGQLIQKTKYSMTIAWLLLPLALYDQVSFGVMRNFTTNQSEFSNYKKFAEQIEQNLGENQKIYTLPFGQYPEGNDKNIMKLALLTKNTYWSAGAQKWRSSNYWQYKTSQQSPEQMLQTITKEGFTGLIIYKPNFDSQKIETFTKIIKTKPLIGPTPNEEYVFFNLNEYISQNKISITPEDFYYYISGYCVHNYDIAQVITEYYCVDKVTIVLINNSDVELKKTLKADFTFAPDTIQNYEQQITVPKGNSKYYINLPETASKSVFIKPNYWPSNLGYPNVLVKNIDIN